MLDPIYVGSSTDFVNVVTKSYFVLHAGFIPAKQETLLHMDA